MPKPNLQRNARTVRAAILARTKNAPLPEVNWPELELDTTALPPYRPTALPPYRPTAPTPCRRVRVPRGRRPGRPGGELPAQSIGDRRRLQAPGGQGRREGRSSHGGEIAACRHLTAVDHHTVDFNRGHDSIG
jgi:hypothetical protein